MNKVCCLLIMILPIIPVKAQTLARNDALKFDADYYLMEKEFDKARNAYLNILRSEPENADIKYRLGICYLNSENEKEKAIPVLEEAVQKVSEKHNPNSFKEMNAPVDAWFLLGSAYRVNNELDKAIEAYSKYKEFLDPKDEYNNEVINQYIGNCHLAREMQQKPISLITVNLGNPINSAAPNFNAVISGDGKTMFYTSPGKQGYDIYSTTFADTGWTSPRIITSILGTGKYMKTADLSNDGQTLLLVLDDPMNADIYESHFNKGRWSKVEALGKEINSKSNETHASLSPDGKTLYFTSNRKGGEGDLDIYKSEIDNKGEWGKPVNLGPVINTRFNEETPFVTDDGQQLYFSSDGHNSIGGYDIFRYDLINPGSPVVNVGYPLNTTDNDLFYVPIGDGSTAYYSFKGIDSYGGRDIYRVTIIPPVVEELAVEEPAAVAVEEAAAVAVGEPVAVAVEEPAAVVVEEATAVAVEEATPVAVEEAAAVAVEEAAAVAVEEVALVEAVNLADARSYTIQFMALRKLSDFSVFKGLTDITLTYGPDKWYRYTLGASTDITYVQKELEKLVGKGYQDAFIRGKPIIPKYTIQVMAVPGPIVDLDRFGNLSEISVTRGDDSFCRYTTGEFETMEEAQTYLGKILSLGYRKAFIAKIRIQE